MIQKCQSSQLCVLREDSNRLVSTTQVDPRFLPLRHGKLMTQSTFHRFNYQTQSISQNN